MSKPKTDTTDTQNPAAPVDGAKPGASTPDSSDKEAQVQASIASKLQEEGAAKDLQIQELTAQIGDYQNRAEAAEAKLEPLEKQLAAALAEAEDLRKRLNASKTASVKLAKGEGQLTESVTLIGLSAQRYDARPGDLVVVAKNQAEGDKRSILRQTEVGKRCKVYAVSEAQLQELIESRHVAIAE